MELFNRALTPTEIQDIYNAGPAEVQVHAKWYRVLSVGWVEDVDEEPLEGVTVAINEKGCKGENHVTDDDGITNSGDYA